jgi:two-component system chemotaxis response regulator CheY
MVRQRTPKMKTAIVVDDDDLVRSTVSFILRALNFDVTEAACGEVALKLLSETPFDLVITDLFMPEFNGLELILGVKKLALTTPIVLMTGGGRNFPPGSEYLDNLTESAELFGASYVIHKPFKKNDLAKIVDNALAQK